MAWNQSSEGAKGCMKPSVATHSFSTFAQALAIMATNFWQEG